MLHGTLGGAVDERPGPAGVPDRSVPAPDVRAGGSPGWPGRPFGTGTGCRSGLAASFALLLPIFNANHYDVEYDGRYVMPLLPMIYACIGLLLVDGWRAVAARSASAGDAGWRRRSSSDWWSWCWPRCRCSRWRGTTRQASRAEPTNASLVRAMDEVKPALRPGDVVLLDNNLNDRRTEYASPLGRGVDVSGDAVHHGVRPGAVRGGGRRRGGRWPTSRVGGRPASSCSAPASTARTRRIWAS